MGLIRQKCSIRQYQVKENRKFPNSVLPVLHYRKALNLPLFFPAFFIKKLLSSNGWKKSWTNGVYDYHHYHSNTHEVLVFYKGKTILQLGGEEGIKIDVEKGDVLIIPAGVAHCNLGSEHSIYCVGAYPGKKNYDMNYGRREERPKADENIRKVPLPRKDPLFGTKGGIRAYWKESVWELWRTH